MSTTTYSVPDMSCAHCEKAITDEVSAVAGVESVSIDLDAKTVTVAGGAADDAIRGAIDEAGYDIADA
ncbi:MAG: heavy-metal-associated domain-containing protein [Acidimicrobiales bacterium]